MANLKLHTIGIHGGFHHNFLCTVVRTVREKQRTKLVIESLHLLDLPRMSWDFLLPSSSLIYACSTLSHSSSSVFLWPSFPYPFSNHLNQFKFGPYYSARGCLRARAHFTFGRGDALHSPLAVGSASLSTFRSSANATPNPIWRLGPSVDFFRRSSALDSGAAVAARRLVAVVT